MLLRLFFIPFLFLLAPTLSVAADITERNAFLAAEQAYKRGDATSYQRLKSDLRDYPLFPYLEYQELRGRISTVRPVAIRNYLDTYPDTPTAQRLRKAWLNQLAKKARWAEYLEFYDPNDISIDRQCHYLRALIATGRSKDAFARTPEIWLHGESRPDACDAPIDAWRKAGQLTTDLVWDRIELAMDAGSLTLAKYMKRFLPAADRSGFDLWIKVNADPATWLPTLSQHKADAVTKRILAHGIKRLARTDPHRAAQIWRASRGRFDFTEAESCALDERLAIALEDESDAAAYRFFLELEPCTTQPRLLEARVRAALLHRDWPSVASWIDDLADDQQNDERWQYWKARALEVGGREKQARDLYKRASAERTYYGFLAADRIGAPYRYDDVAIDVDAEVLEQVRRMPAMQRMQELYALDRIVDARREWLLLISGLDQNELLAASRIFDDWGWLDRAIFTSARAGYWDDMELRFPLEHTTEVARHAGARNLDTSWVFGVLRQESAFMSDARSSAGAIGLMQLMPATARQVARKLGMPKPSLRSLTNPGTNIELGTAYMRMMLDDLFQEEVLATAAYNAGPHRVTRWLKGSTLPMDIWVELIPFKETRTYVQRVLAYAVIYDERLGNPTRRLSERMHSTRPGA